MIGKATRSVEEDEKRRRDPHDADSEAGSECQAVRLSAVLCHTSLSVQSGRQNTPHGVPQQGIAGPRRASALFAGNRIGVNMAIPIAPLAEGTRVRVVQGPFPQDLELLGK